MGVLALAIFCWFLGRSQPVPESMVPDTRLAQDFELRVNQALGQGRVFFEPVGDDRRERYAGSGPGYGIELDRDGIAMTGKGGRQLTIRFHGKAPEAVPSGIAPLPGRFHYLQGDQPASWRRNVTRYEAVRYSQLYPGVDLVFYGNGAESEFDLVLQPSASPERIRFGIEEADSVTLDPSGTLLFRADGEEFRLESPRIYQRTADNRRIQVAGGYRLEGDEVSFEVDEYDPNLALVIDPIIRYSTFVGTIREAQVVDVAIDDEGNTFVGGPLLLIPGDQFTGVNAIRDQQGAGNECFLAKYDTQGELEFLTLFGGSGDERLIGLTVDAAGRPWFTGWTTSSDFPKVSAFQSTRRGPSDAFVAELSAAGDQILFSSLLGGNGGERLESANFGVLFGHPDYGDIEVDSGGNAYLTGITSSSDFPTVNPFQASGSSNASPSFDAFVAKIGSDRTVSWASYLGGKAEDLPTDLALDGAGRLYLVGGTKSSDFPLKNAFRADFEAEGSTMDFSGRFVSPEGFLSLISANGTQLVTSTFVGDKGDDEILAGVAVGPGDEAYVLGHTNSPEFPTAPAGGAALEQLQGVAGGLTLADTFRGQTDLFVMRLDNDATEVGWSGLLGGSLQEFAGALAIGDGHLYLTGRTNSPDFPLLNPLIGGDEQLTVSAMVAGIDTADRSIPFSTFLNAGSGGTEGWGIATVNGWVQVGGNNSFPVAGRNRSFPLVRAASRGVGFTADGFSTLLVPSRGKLLGPGPEWARTMRVDSNRNGVPDPADEIVTIERQGDVLELISTRWGVATVELLEKDGNGRFSQLQIATEIRVTGSSFLNYGKVRARTNTTVELTGYDGENPIAAAVLQERTGIEIADGSERDTSQTSGAIRLLDQDEDGILDSVSLEPEDGPRVIVSLVLVDVDSDGEADFVTLPWNLSALFGLRNNTFITPFQPFVPLADTDGDGINDSPAFDFDEDDVADADFPRATVSGPDSEAEYQLNFAHFGEGGDLIFSQLFLFPLNSTGDVQARVILRDDSGAPLEVDLNGEVVDGQKDYVIPSCGLLVLETDGKGPVVSGTVTVISDRPLGGVILFGGVVGVAGVGSSPEVGRGFRSPIEEDGGQGIRSGVAVMGLETNPLHLVFRLLDPEGNELASTERDLPVGGHLAIFIDQLFEQLDLSEFLGTLIVEANGRVTATVLQTYPGEFVTMPVAGLADYSRSLRFAHFGDGAGILFSKFLLMNLSPGRDATYGMAVRNDQGLSLTFDLDGEEYMGFTPQSTISSSGVQRRTTDGMGDVISGSVDLLASSGQLSGVIVFGGSLGVAGVGASPSFPRGFIAPVDSQTAASVDTGIALLNVRDQTGTLHLELYDSGGTLLAKSTLSIPFSGHDARFLQEYEWVPEAGVTLDFSSFRGLIKVRSRGPITGTVLQVRGSSQFATMPTSPILQ